MISHNIHLFFPTDKTEVSDEDIQDIVDVWKLTDLDNLFPKLHLTNVEISNEQALVGDRKQSTKNILTLWRNSKYPDNKRKDMLKAMSKNDAWKRSMNAVKEKWANQNK